MMPRWVVFVVFFLALAGSSVARAHGLDPIGISIRESANAEILVAIDRPATLPRGGSLDVSLGAGCSGQAPTVTAARLGRLLETHRYRCEGPLTGSTVTVQGLDAAGLDAVVRVEERDGAVHRAVLSSGSPRMLVREPPSRVGVVGSYVLLGAEHLARGADHLAFILGIALLARRARRIAVALTAFTVGHSVTLSAVALGLVRLPSAWAELAIAATLVWLAIEVVRGPLPDSRVARLALACSVVGLVHGLGFATALSEIGLPERDVPLALFGFNLGIEMAQLAVVAIAWVAVQLGNRLRPLDWDRARPWVGHAIGAVAAMWCLERLVAL